MSFINRKKQLSNQNKACKEKINKKINKEDSDSAEQPSGHRRPHQAAKMNI